MKYNNKVWAVNSNISGTSLIDRTKMQKILDSMKEKRAKVFYPKDCFYGIYGVDPSFYQRTTRIIFNKNERFK